MMTQDHGMVSVESAVRVRRGKMEEECRIVVNHEPDMLRRWMSEPPR
jgi:hypothetical protein